MLGLNQFMYKERNWSYESSIHMFIAIKYDIFILEHS